MPKLKHNLDWDILCQLSKYQSYSWDGGGWGWYKLKVKPTWDRMPQLKHNLDWDIPLPVSKYQSYGWGGGGRYNLKVKPT